MYIEKGGDANLVNFANLNAEQNDEWSKDARLATKELALSPFSPTFPWFPARGNYSQRKSQI